MIPDYFTLAFRNLRKRRLRSWLTILGIIISIATIFMLVSVSLGLQAAVEEQFRILGTDKFFIQPRGTIAGPGTSSASILTTDDINVIEKVPGVKDISYFYANNAEIEFSNEKRFFFVIALPEGKSSVFQELQSYKIDEGRFLEESDSGAVMIGSQYKYNSVYKRAVRARDRLSIQGKEFKVRGILQTVGNPADDRNIFVNLRDFEKIFPEKVGIDQIIVQIEHGQDIKAVSKRVEKKLLNSRGLTEKTRDFIILTPEELLASFGNILNIITSFLFGVAVISLLVGGIGIANTMYTSVLERTREIGTMKAVGAKNSDILLIFLIESGLIGAVGGIIGVFLGIAVSKTIEYIAINQLGTTLLQAALPFYLIVGCVLFAFLSGAISGVWPAWRASKLKAVDALRYE